MVSYCLWLVSDIGEGWIKRSTQILIVEESKVSWEIKPLLWPTDNPAGTGLCCSVCSIDAKHTLESEEVCTSVGFSWCLKGWLPCPGLPRISFLALNTLNPRNSFMLAPVMGGHPHALILIWGTASLLSFTEHDLNVFYPLMCLLPLHWKSCWKDTK